MRTYPESSYKKVFRRAVDGLSAEAFKLLYKIKEGIPVHSDELKHLTELLKLGYVTFQAKIDEKGSAYVIITFNEGILELW